MPGWRVGYTVAPKALTDSFRKVSIYIHIMLIYNFAQIIVYVYVRYMSYATLILYHNIHVYMQIQDTIPTNAPMIAQKLALACLNLDDDLHPTSDYHIRSSSSSSSSNDSDSSSGTEGWVRRQVLGLRSVREAVWEAVRPMGAVKTDGAFYYLVPVPPHVRHYTRLLICIYCYTRLVSCIQ